MHIKSASFNHHKIFGSVKVNFFGNSEPLADNSLSNSRTDIFVDIEETDTENYYTFIIGDNGVGKSVFMRNIIHFANWNNKIDEPRLSKYIDFHENNLRYVRFKNSDLGTGELLDVNIYNKYFYIPGVNETDFLKNYNAQLIYINGSYEKGIIHKNPRFRSFNYSSEINDTKNLFLNALIKFKSDEKLRALGQLLGDKDVIWKLSCGLALEASTVKDGNDKNYNMLLAKLNGVSIFNFLSLVANIRIDANDKVVKESLGREEEKVLDVLYNSGAFFKLYFNSGLSFFELFNRMRTSNIISSIEAFLWYDIGAINAEKNLNVRVNEEQKARWDFLVTEASDLNSFDALFIGLLSSLNLLKVTITANGTSTDTMSSGQKNLIRLFSYFADMPLPDQMSNAIIFFDEPENSLHPKWQQEFPANFKNIVEGVYGIKSSHFIFATHSPVLIMRSALLPRSNVLRFYNDEQGQFKSDLIKNVSTYSIEEVLLDEFRIAYRDQSAEDAMRKALDSQFKKRNNQQDPADAIKNSFDLRDKINHLYNEINKTE